MIWISGFGFAAHFLRDVASFVFGGLNAENRPIPQNQRAVSPSSSHPSYPHPGHSNWHDKKLN